MDNLLTIKIEALDNASKKIDNISNTVNKAGNTIDRNSKKFNNFSKKMESVGSRINVLGQRLTLFATVPLLFFARSAIQTAVDVETAWTRFEKVFSGTEEQIASLKKAGTKLSEKFGIDVEEVAGVMGEFNKAGINSEDMLKDLTEQALETSILFDTDLAGAFDGIKSVMFGFGLDAEKTKDALAAINTVADTTTTSEKDILDVMQKSGAIFKQYHVSVTEAAAITSLLAQSNIKGKEAGTALKTIFAKIGDATPKATKEMSKFGINVRSNAFRTATFADKLKILNSGQKDVFSSGNKVKIADWNTAIKDLVGIRQANRFQVLVDKVEQLDGVIDSASDSTKNLERWNKQLNKVLDSTPNKLKIMNQIYRNQKVILGKELIPLKMKLLEMMIKLIKWFNALSPVTKEWIVKIGAVIAVLGPLLAFLGILVSSLGFVFDAITLLTLKGFIPLIKKMGYVTSITSDLGLAFSGGLVLALSAVVAYITTKAYKAFQGLQDDIKNLREVTRQAREKLDKFQESVGKLSTDKANEQLQNSIDKARELANEANNIANRYEGLPGVWNAIKDQSAPIWSAITGFIKESWNKVTTFLSNKWEEIKLKVKEAFNAITGFIKESWNKVTTFTTDEWNKLTTFLSNKWEEIKLKVKEAFNAIIIYFKNDFIKDLGFAIGFMVVTIALFPKYIADALTNLGKFVWNNAIKPSFKFLWEKTKEWIRILVDAWVEMIPIIWQAIKDLGRSVWNNAIKPSFKFLWEKTKEWIRILVDAWSNAPELIWQALKDFGSFLWKNIFIPAKNFITEKLPSFIDNIIKFFKELPGKAVDALTGLGKKLIKKFKEELKKLKEFISGLGKGGKKALEVAGLKNLNFGGIAENFNQGGMVYAANGYLARGRDTIPAMLSPGEMVLNKSQQSTLFDVLAGKTQMQTAGGPTVNINVGTMIASRGEQREFARKIEELLTENSNRR